MMTEICGTEKWELKGESWSSRSQFFCPQFFCQYFFGLDGPSDAARDAVKVTGRVRRGRSARGRGWKRGLLPPRRCQSRPT